MSILKLRPLVGFLLVVALCHGGMWLLAFVVEHRVLDWSKQYFGFVYGDILLAVAFAVGLWANRYIGLPDRNRWSQLKLTRLVAFVVVLSIAVWRWAFNDYNAYSVGQDASPTKLYHDTLFVLVGYLVLMVVLPLVGRSWSVLVPLALVAGWKTAYAHVDYQWWVKDFVQKYLDPILRRR